MPDHASRFSLEGKKALVTGASRGIGAEIATVFAHAGADLGIVGRDAECLETTRDAIAATGRRCVVIQADLRTVDGPRTAGARGLELLGTVAIRPLESSIGRNGAATFDSRQAYADAKTDFVTRITVQALAQGLPR